MMTQFTNEKEFDNKLSEIGECYESIKDALNSMYAPSNRLDFERAFENLVTLRNIAAMQLKENYNKPRNKMSNDTALKIIKDNVAKLYGYADFTELDGCNVGQYDSRTPEIIDKIAYEFVSWYKENLKAAVKKAIDNHYSIGSMDVLNEEEIKTLIENLNQE